VYINNCLIHQIMSRKPEAVQALPEE